MSLVCWELIFRNFSILCHQVSYRGTFEDYPTPNSFFTRDLCPNARPIFQNPKTIVSPVDGTISIMDEVDVWS